MRRTSAERSSASRVVPSVVEAWAHGPFDGGVAHWVTVTLGGRPCARVRIPPVGAVASPGFWDLAVGRHARAASARARAEARVLARLGGAVGADVPPVSVSVVVCTHRRPEDLARCLGALARLAPAPAEVVVVDNDPGELDVREQVVAAGARYVREDRRGLDQARQAGLRAAGGEVVCFTDDDCLPSQAWLATVAQHFSDPAVAALTGPGFAAELETPAQLRFEESAGFTRGLERRCADWTTVAPVDAISLGAGACMAFRRTHLLATPSPFPAELDAGTPTQSGGDHVALASVLAAGHRVIYDPAFYVLHRHRRDWHAMNHTFWGYGVGLSAALTRLLVCDGEVRAIHAAGWVARNYGAAQVKRLLGRADGVDVRIAWDYLRGGLVGWWRWLLSWPPDRGAGPDVAAESPGPAAAGPPSAGEPAGAPALSVIVTTRARPDALERCLLALSCQRGDTPFEVVVCDDDPGESARPLPWREGWRLVRTGGRGAAAARNTGALHATAPRLLFLDDDLVPAPDLVVRHARDADDEDLVLIGRCPPAPRTSNLTTLQAVTWWKDYYRERERVLAVTFRDVLSGNMSIARSRFDALGGFDEGFGAGRREDWEWGIRVLRAGLRVEFDPDARAAHELSLTTRKMLDVNWRDGCGDRVLLDRAPEAAAALPTWDLGRLAPLGRVAARLLATSSGRSAYARALGLLERCRFRGLWLRAMRVGQGAAYWGGRGSRAAASVPAVAVDLADDQSIPGPELAAPLLHVSVGGTRLGVVTPAEGRWGPGVAAQLVEAGGERMLGRVAHEEIPEPDVAPDALRIDEMVWAAERPWSEVARRLAASTADVVIVGFGAPASEPRLISAAFLADRVAVVAGTQSETVRDSGLTLSERAGHEAVEDTITFLAVRPAACRRLPRPGAAVTGLGPLAVSMHVAAAATDAGELVGRLNINVPDRSPRPQGRRGPLARAAVAATRPAPLAARLRRVGDAITPDPLPGARRVGAITAVAAAAAVTVRRRARRRW